VSSSFPTTAHLLELGHEVPFVHIAQREGKPIRRLLQVCKLRRPDRLARCGDIDAEGFAATGNRDGRIRFQKTRYLFPKLPHTNLDRRHMCLLVHTQVCTKYWAIQTTAGGHRAGISLPEATSGERIMVGLILDNIIVFLYRIIRTGIGAYRSQAWLATTGEVEESNAPEHEMYPFARVSYSYVANGVDHSGIYIKGFWYDSSAKVSRRNSLRAAKS